MVEVHRNLSGTQCVATIVSNPLRNLPVEATSKSLGDENAWFIESKSELSLESFTVPFRLRRALRLSYRQR